MRVFDQAGTGVATLGHRAQEVLQRNVGVFGFDLVRDVDEHVSDDIADFVAFYAFPPAHLYLTL
jgi:hypothetical protein